LSERTFSIIKPDAVKAGTAGQILARIEGAGFKPVALRMRHLTKSEAEGFYYVHKARPFFGSLVDFMTSGPCITMVLEKAGAIPALRELMGATDPAKAAAGTIRKDFAESIEANAIHGSDAAETAAFEIGYFFAGLELPTAG
jgi:nucleoside-diphosphate kinase